LGVHPNSSFTPSPTCSRRRSMARPKRCAPETTPPSPKWQRLLPVNANELDLAAQCIAARAQAEDILRLLRENADDIGLVIRLNAQYGSMVRTSLSVHGRLMRVQALRRKREAIEGAADEDAWTLHVTERSMLEVADPKDRPLAAARPKAAPVAVPVAAPAPHVDPRIEESASENRTSSHDLAFETSMSKQPWNQGPGDRVKRVCASGYAKRWPNRV